MTFFPGILTIFNHTQQWDIVISILLLRSSNIRIISRHTSARMVDLIPQLSLLLDLFLSIQSVISYPLLYLYVFIISHGTWPGWHQRCHALSHSNPFAIEHFSYGKSTMGTEFPKASIFPAVFFYGCGVGISLGRCTQGFVRCVFGPLASGGIHHMSHEQIPSLIGVNPMIHDWIFGDYRG